MPVPTEPQAERPARAGLGSFRWLAANGIVLAFVLLGVWRVLPRDDRQPDDSAPALVETQAGWWETRQSIYYQIPARVVFQLPGDPARARAVSDAVWSEFERIGRIFNPFDATSEVGRLNAAVRAGQRTAEGSADLLAVARLSRRLWEASEGRFDPTIWPLREVWRDAVKAQAPPTDAQLAEALTRVGFDGLALPTGDGTSLSFAGPGLTFDFGGISKGYAIDRVEAVLREAGVENALVQLGGEVSTFGSRDGEPWRIGVQHPRDMNAIWGVIERVQPARVSTSGNYRQPLLIAGEAYYHIFDPRSGRPVPTRVLSVTTADLHGRASSALLDGAATAITALGPEAGLELARLLQIDALVLFEGEDGAIREVMSEALAPSYRRAGS